ncbi:STAS domain-containing protein [Neptuniibacter caesariensis]|uniref:Possible anti-sigma factor antagonist n=1 Tax=Neptuniibacter caesariensis TaxID=207954 RepID=A0A7U8GT28_NEPCE|nr:STAS domain-containing protein [Neptuniibacter caesariensis]EAR62006.1 possible anti-sigma factor antagonist [Oceanospirillum sp. MED92] [Neptuniibacter caesariensis]
MSNLATVKSDLFLALDGSLDALAVEILKPRFDELVQSHSDVVLVLNKTDFIDSSGIGAIVFLFKRLREVNRKLSLVGVHGQPLELLNHLRINKTIDIN